MKADMSKRIIGITGRIGSGKTLVSNHISERFGNAPILKFSDIILDILRRLHLKPTRQNFQKLGALLRKELGKEIIVHAMLNDLKLAEDDVIIIDGFRYMNEVSMLRHFERSVLIGIDASPELRYERIVARGEEKTGECDKNFEEFLESEEAATEKEVDLVLKEAEYRVKNIGITKEELLKKVDEIIDGLGK